MKIIYTAHLELRLSVRHIPYHLPRKILNEADEHYYDTLTKHYIALFRVRFEDRYREMIIVYDKKKDLREIITIHPIKAYQKASRINSGRWRKI